MAVAAAGIAIHLLDQLADRADAVADHLRRDTLGDRDHAAVDDQDAVVVAGEEALDDDDAPLGLGLRRAEAEAELLLAGDADGDAAAVIAVERLGHQRVAKP